MLAACFGSVPAALEAPTAGVVLTFAFASGAEVCPSPEKRLDGGAVEVAAVAGVAAAESGGFPRLKTLLDGAAETEVLLLEVAVGLPPSEKPLDVGAGVDEDGWDDAGAVALGKLNIGAVVVVLDDKEVADCVFDGAAEVCSAISLWDVPCCLPRFWKRPPPC